MTVRRRHTDLENLEVVIAVASEIQREVNLDNPDKIVLVEIVGDVTLFITGLFSLGSNTELRIA